MSTRAHLPAVLIFFFLLCCAASALGAGKEAPPPTSGYEKYLKDISLIAQVDANYLYSTSDTSSSFSGGGIAALIAPRYRITDKTLFIFLYDGSYSKDRDYDNLGSIPVTHTMHSFTPMLRIKLGQTARFSITPSLFYVTSKKDYENSVYNDLYDYTDLGLGLDFLDRDLGFGGADGQLKLGLQVYERTYPEYTNPEYISDITGIESEKDYLGIMPSIGYYWLNEKGFSAYGKYSLLFKTFDDSKVKTQEGELTDETQQDQMHIFDVRVSYKFDLDLELGLDSSLTLHDSNQNEFDNSDTPAQPGDDIPLPRFYNYNLFLIRPDISYAFEPVPLAITLFYLYQLTEYTDRDARDSGGNYITGEKQWEKQERVSLRFDYDLHPSWRLFCGWQYIYNKSNNTYERYYQYNYIVNNYSIGVSYTYK